MPEGALAQAEDETHWDRRRVAISLHIEKTALTLFLRHGVDAVSVEEIADTAKISQRTFFRYFPARDDVLTAAPARNLRYMVEALRRRPREEHILDAIERSVVREEDLAPQERVLLRLSKRLMRAEPATFARAVRRMFANTEDALMEALEQRLGGDDVLASALTGVLAHVFRTWLHGGRFGSFAARTQQVLQALNGLLATHNP